MHSGDELPESRLEVVQIYFDTASFDEIERDKKIKFEAHLSLIGGTMTFLLESLLSVVLRSSAILYNSYSM